MVSTTRKEIWPRVISYAKIELVALQVLDRIKMAPRQAHSDPGNSKIELKEALPKVNLPVHRVSRRKWAGYHHIRPPEYTSRAGYQN